MDMEKFSYSKETDIKWQKKWNETGLYRFDESKVADKFYLLEQFAYPSGKNLHIGHWWIYGLADSYARFKRMQGYQVFHPPGFDAFGLPAENFAIRTGVHPSDSTAQNIATMEAQFRAMGTTYDWHYELVTCREEYYQWTQWIFLKLYENGLAYRKAAPVNWCPSCMTVLANEQAADGQCERCNSTVVSRHLTQWFFKITDYADELLDSLNTLDWPESTKAIQRNWIGKSVDAEGNVEYRLHDWLISRQRYWGTSIPIIYCEDCGTVPVSEADLPVRLPYDVAFLPNGQSPLASCDAFVNTGCPVCGKPAKRDTDTLDTFVCSSWYFLRYFDNKNVSFPFDKDRIRQIMPVDMYVGGVEHATMHLLYARFFTKALRDMGYLDFDEPFPRIFHQGLITGSDGKKMSKRDGAISPDVMVDQYGADVFRMFLGFGFSYSDGGPWDDDGIKAVARFVQRVSRLVERFMSFKLAQGSPTGKTDETLEYVRNYTVKQVGNDLEQLKFNSAIARIMEFVNAISAYQKSDMRCAEYEEGFIKDLIVLLAPFAPHLAEALWEYIGCDYSIHNQKFPICDEAKLVKNMQDIAVQVDGRLREVVSLPSGLSEEEVTAAVLDNEIIQGFIDGREIEKIIYVKGRIVNFVLK